jgi:hypothetical protein
VARERPAPAKPEFLSATKSRARNFLDSMKVTQRVTKTNERGSRFVQTDTKATEQTGYVLHHINTGIPTKTATTSNDIKRLTHPKKLY